MKRTKIAALVLLPISILAAYASEAWLSSLLSIGGETFDYTSATLLTPVIDLSFAALMLGIFWIVRQARDWRISALYLCVGLLLILYPISRWFGWGLTRSIPLELDRVAVSFQHGFWLLGAFIAVAGVWSMFSSRE